MKNYFFDYDSGNYANRISDNLAINNEGNMMMRLSDHLALDMDSGDTRFISSWKMMTMIIE